MKLGKVQEAGNKQIQTLEFNLRQIVLGNLHVILGHIVTLEVRHTHKRLFVVHTIVDNFRCRILVNGIMQFVLHSGKEHLCHLIAWVIIRGSCINIRNLLVEVPLAATNIPDTLEQLTEIPIAPLLQPLIIHRKSLLDILMKPLSSPTTETGSNL